MKPFSFTCNGDITCTVDQLREIYTAFTPKNLKGVWEDARIKWGVLQKMGLDYVPQSPDEVWYVGFDQDPYLVFELDPVTVQVSSSGALFLIHDEETRDLAWADIHARTKTGGAFQVWQMVDPEKRHPVNGAALTLDVPTSDPPEKEKHKCACPDENFEYNGINCVCGGS